MLNFLDAYSKYHQISMHKSEQDKITFITGHGLYYYTRMPFGLKNAGATYQCLINHMFNSQIGRTMEVYIDDMLAKSLHTIEHLEDLATCDNTT